MIEVRVLGPIDGLVDGRETHLASPTQRVLLAALAHARSHPVSTDLLSWLVWGDSPPPAARASLKSHLSRLRRILGDGTIVARPPGYALAVRDECVDVSRFERLVHDGATVAELGAALSLWRGPPYGELSDHEHFAPEAARLTELHTQVWLRRADLLRADARIDEAIAEYTALARADPLREQAWIGLVAALGAGGRQADATAAARRYRRHVVAVGLEPSQQFVEVERGIYARHTAPIAGPSRLPARVASIVGRDDELDRLGALLVDQRLVTLVGPGGVGKTTLAAEAARRAAAAFPDGRWMSALTEIRGPMSGALDSGHVVPAVTRAVGAPAIPPLEESLERYLAERRALVVLDNAEHLHGEVRAFAERLVAACASVHVLTTSRQPLGIPGETIVRVEPLQPEPARALFELRARESGRSLSTGDHDLVAELCRHLDQLPLAIEMAAARLRGLSITDLVAQLQQHPHALRSAAPDATRLSTGSSRGPSTSSTPSNRPS